MSTTGSSAKFRLVEAIVLAKENRQTHVQWRDFQLDGGVLTERERNYVGDVAHHQAQIDRYTRIIEAMEVAVKELDHAA